MSEVRIAALAALLIAAIVAVPAWGLASLGATPAVLPAGMDAVQTTKGMPAGMADAKHVHGSPQTMDGGAVESKLNGSHPPDSNVIACSDGKIAASRAYDAQSGTTTRVIDQSVGGIYCFSKITERNHDRHQVGIVNPDTGNIRWKDTWNEHGN